jgi:hypothetical protein
MIQTIQSLNVLIRNIVQLCARYHNRVEKVYEVFRDVCVFNLSDFIGRKSFLLTR